MNRKLLFNILALITVTIWGSTFVATKMLILNGLTPTWIFILRFLIAYLCVLIIYHKTLWSDSLRDELYLLAGGISGGSLYFIAENTALEYTFASNVSLIICTTPILTLFLSAIIYRHKITYKSIAGSLLALSGVAIVILNGSLNFGIKPVGDMLTLLAALCWAVYCLLLKKLNIRYPNLFITRKIFFYGFVTALPVAMLQPIPHLPSQEALPAVVGNLAFLSLFASFICYIIWNNTVKALGPEKSANYIYFNPIITIIVSSAILSEPVTPWLLAGTVIIISGVYLCSK
ncbi:MAG: DMT family transporter [Muribaculaceae bacterium]|nr:DMT family transporter [Muribaculaceae bacterium]